MPDCSGFVFLDVYDIITSSSQKPLFPLPFLVDPRLLCVIEPLLALSLILCRGRGALVGNSSGRKVFGIPSVMVRKGRVALPAIDATQT
jgi:hypothetical protein